MMDGVALTILERSKVPFLQNIIRSALRKCSALTNYSPVPQINAQIIKGDSETLLAALAGQRVGTVIGALADK